MPLELMQLPCEEDSDFFGDENLQVYVGTVLTPKQIEEILCMLRCHQSHVLTQLS
jgi:hypothetical protein